MHGYNIASASRKKGLRGNFDDFFFISNIERVHRKQSNDVKFISKFHVKRKISANEKGRKSSRTI